jgi:hypothetical protein
MNKFGAKLMSEIVQPILTQKLTGYDVYDDQVPQLGSFLC